MTHLTARDWILVVAVAIFVAFNFYLWSLPISQAHLLLISTPLGIAAMAAIMWFVGRQNRRD